jgi:type II secretory pathway pseudopilin PulG
MISPHQESGFSLVETLVAITLLLLVIVGPMSISSSAARSTSFSSEQVIALFLAQEGAELVQKARDDLQLEHFESPPSGSPVAWNDFADSDPSDLYHECFDSAGCGLQVINGDSDGNLDSPVECSSNSCRLFLDSAGGRTRYSYDTTVGTSTPFTRQIIMDEIATGEVEVISRVSWQSGDQRQVQTVEVTTSLFNVYEN